MTSYRHVLRKWHNNGDTMQNDTKRMNHLTGKEWVQWSKSIWRFSEPVKDNYGHPAIFPDFVAERLIRIYTRQGQMILDPMVGTGTTVAVAKGLNRNAIGIELSEHWAKIADNRLTKEYKPYTITDEDRSLNKWVEINKESNKNGQQEYIFPNICADTHKIICDDARNLLDHIKPDSIDFCLTSPPYWVGLHGVNGKYTGQTQKKYKQYSESEYDLGNIQNYESFISSLISIYEKILIVLKPGGYFACIVQDSRRGSKVYPIHIDLYNRLSETGFEYQDVIIWEHLLYTTRPLGYTSTFVISRIHDYIMTFRKI